MSTPDQKGSSGVDKRKASGKVMTTMFPRIPKTASVLLEFFIRRESTVSLLRDPLSHFCQEEMVLHAQECLLKLSKQVINYQDIRDMVENLVGLHTLCLKKDPDVARTLGQGVRKLIIIVAEVGCTLEKIAEVTITDWLAIGDAIVNKVERMNPPKQPPFSIFIPKMRDFTSLKMLGAGGFGAVYLANYRPASFIATVKLVAMDRFSRHKQAAMDKVVASVIRNPFLVKYYSCFCVKLLQSVQCFRSLTMHYCQNFLDTPSRKITNTGSEFRLVDVPTLRAAQLGSFDKYDKLFQTLEAYVTIMEYIAGLDLMRVVTKEEYMEIGAVQIIMAQLILAIEHMHLRGFLHRDIKVSNMLILPGGRVKVIDFDTTKVCNGHFAKRMLRGYFRRTAFEFNDGESAGTIPYMAPEILKRRPYGRAADWWSSGIVMYKLMTGRVPFRGKTKQMLRERIITAPLKWPRAEDHPNSATTPAKDMTYRMLKKNPVERLGSKTYTDLKTHSFFDRFNWQRLYDQKELCDIPSIQELLLEDAERDRRTCPDPEDKRRHQQIEEMTDVSSESQKPLLCYASSSFKKLMRKVRKSKTRVKVTDSFMETTGETTSGIDYQGNTPGQSSIKTGLSSVEGQGPGLDKVDLTLHRKKQLCKYWSFGFSLQRVRGEGNNFHTYVDSVEKGSPADRSQVLPLDIVLSVNNNPVAALPLERVKKLISSSGEQLVLSVMSSSVYRMMITRRDMMALMRTINRDTVVLPPSGGKMPFGLGIVDAGTWDDKAQQPTRVCIVTHAMVPSTNRRPLFPGDVVLQVDGRPMEGVTKEQLMQQLSATKQPVTLVVAPISPFRQNRILISKLHETGMTDSNIPSRSTAAGISTQ